MKLPSQDYTAHAPFHQESPCGWVLKNRTWVKVLCATFVSFALNEIYTCFLPPHSHWVTKFQPRVNEAKKWEKRKQGRENDGKYKDNSSTYLSFAGGWPRYKSCLSSVNWMIHTQSFWWLNLVPTGIASNKAKTTMEVRLSLVTLKVHGWTCVSLCSDLRGVGLQQMPGNSVHCIHTAGRKSSHRNFRNKMMSDGVESENE